MFIYILAGVLWGAYAARKQLNTYPRKHWSTRSKDELVKLGLVIAINLVLWPVCIIIATAKNV